MQLKDIPIRTIGPGSQPSGDEALSYIDMPGDMWTYQPPAIPEALDVRRLDGAREAMRWLQEALSDNKNVSATKLANLTALDDQNRELVNQILGEGEVSITFDGAVRARTQEAVLAGVWRTVYLDQDDRTIADILEVGDVSHVVRLPASGSRSVDVSTDDVPANVMNALPILVELHSHCARYAETGEQHEINLTLLPLTDADLEFLDRRLGRGPVDTLSRAYGKCQVISTLTPDVWWIRYYNSMGALILSTLQVVDVPEILCAADEDLQDSAQRLDDILAPYWSEDAA